MPRPSSSLYVQYALHVNCFAPSALRSLCIYPQFHIKSAADCAAAMACFTSRLLPDIVYTVPYDYSKKHEHVAS